MATKRDLLETVIASIKNIVFDQVKVLNDKSDSGKVLTDEEIRKLDTLTNITIKALEKLKIRRKKRPEMSSMSNDEIKARLKNAQTNKG